MLLSVEFRFSNEMGQWVHEAIFIFISISGWLFGYFERRAKNRAEERFALQTRRYEAYRHFMNVLDDISVSMKKSPLKSIGDYSNEFLDDILRADEQCEIDSALQKFNSSLISMVQSCCEPLVKINNEINAIKLVASVELLGKLEELAQLVTALNDELQYALQLIGPKPDVNDFKKLELVTKSERWKKFNTLQNEIFMLMRQEIGVGAGL